MMTGTRVLSGLVGAALVLSVGVARAGEDPKPIYEKYCKVCHSIAGEGGKQADKGGPLDHTGSKHDAAWFKQYIADPKSVMPDAKMPKLKLSDEQLQALVDYMSSLK